MEPLQRLSLTKSPDGAERPKSPLSSSQFDLRRFSLKAENEDLKEKLHELQTELLDEKSHEKSLRREQCIEAQQIREEERKHAQSKLTELRRKLYKEKQQEIQELREKLLKEKEKEISYIIKQKDEEFRKTQLNWSREKEELALKLRVQFTNEVREEAQKNHEKQIRKFEVYIEELKEQKKQVEESCKLAQEADKKKVDQMRRMHSEHEQELTRLKKSSWQEGRKQMAEIRQLTNIIHQLEKKLGVESGHYIRLQLEKDSLRDKLDRIKGNEMSGRRSPLSSSRTDLSTDLSMFSFPAPDESNPLWLQLKQQKSTIAQLKQNIQDKNRRIDLLKQKLFKNRKFGPGGVMHRSMDDILSYDSAAGREDCISPQFGYSAASSDTSSLNEESLRSDDTSQDAEMIRRLQKEILQLQRTQSLLQAQRQTTLDVERAQIEKEQLQTDLIDAQRQIDELNKDLVESHDRNELLEFQLQESLQRNFDEGNFVPTFKVPLLCVDYQFSDQELSCSAEEVKARLEELENEKKAVLNRDEQLALQQAKRLLGNISKSKEQVVTTIRSGEALPVSDAAQKNFLPLPVFKDSLSVHGGVLQETDECEYIPGTTNVEDEVFLNEAAVQYGETDSHDMISLKESTRLSDAQSQTEFNESSRVICPSKDMEVQCNIIDVKVEVGDRISEVIYKDDEPFRQVFPAQDISVQTAERFEMENNISQTLGGKLGLIGEGASAFEKVKHSEDRSIQTDAMGWLDGPAESITTTSLHEETRVESNTGTVPDNFNGIVLASIGQHMPASCDAAIQTECDVIGDDVIDSVPEVDEDGVREKHDGEPSEKALLGLSWKENVDEKELDEDATLLDCLVYEKEDVFIVVGESYRKYCKEICRNDYTFDFDDSDEIDAIGFQESAIPADEQTKHVQPADDVTSDGAAVDNNRQELDRSRCVEGDSENLQTLDSDKNVSNAIKQFTITSEVVEDRNVEKREMSTQCDVEEREINVEKVEICPHCLKHLSSAGNESNAIDVGSSLGEVDGLVVETCDTDARDELDFIEDSLPEGGHFQFREMCDFCTQCDLRNDADVSASDVPCLKCDRRKTSCTDIAIQCEFADLLSSSEGMLEMSGISGISGVLQEDDGESLIKEVMALAKECSQNDVLIDQHLSEVVRGQGFYSQFQSGENDGEDGTLSDDGVEVSQENENIEDLEHMELEGTQLNVGGEEKIHSQPDVPLEVSSFSSQCDVDPQYLVEDIFIQSPKTPLVTSSTQYDLEDVGIVPDDRVLLDIHGHKGTQDLVEGLTDQTEKKSSVEVGTQYACEDVCILADDREKLDSALDESEEWPEIPEQVVGDPLNTEQEISGAADDNPSERNGQGEADADYDGTDIPEQNRDLYSEIPNSELCVRSEEEEMAVDEFGSNSEKPRCLYDEETSGEEMENFQWKEVRDVETQCGGNETLEKGVQCTLLHDGQRFGMDAILADKHQGDHEDFTWATEDGNITAEQDEPRSGVVHISEPFPQGSEVDAPEILARSNGGESRVIAENTISNSKLSIDLENVFDEMEAQPTHPTLQVTLTPQVKPAPLVSDELPSVIEERDDRAHSPVEEAMISRTSKAETLYALDETLWASAGSENRRHDEERCTDGDRRGFMGVIGESKDLKHGGIDHDGGQSFSEETSSTETSSQVTVENTGKHSIPRPPSPPLLSGDPPPSQSIATPIQDNTPPITGPPSMQGPPSLPQPDCPPPLPGTLPPTLPSDCPPGVMHSDLDDDIEALLAGELDQDIGDLTPVGIKYPVRPTLDYEIQTMLESEESSVRSEPNTVLSMDSLCVNQTVQPAVGHAVKTSTSYLNTDEMTPSFNGDDDIISDDVTSVTNDDIISEANEDVIFGTNDHMLYGSVEDLPSETEARSNRKSRRGDGISQSFVGANHSPDHETFSKHVAFENEISEESVTESSSVSDTTTQRRQPPPVLPKPKYRSHSMNLPISELPPVPKHGERLNSMAAKRDIVDGCFPPAGLVPKRASEFNHGEFDLLQERIVYLERQLKNKENLLQSMRAEAMEIETNAYLQKKEDDLKMMDESVRFLKVENQKKEKELIAKIGELNKSTFELEQLRSERANAEKQRDILEDNVSSLQDRVSVLQSVQVQNQELRCKYDCLVNENAHLQEQVNHLHRADEEFVDLEKTISKLQGKLKELEDVKRERDDVSEELKALKTQKNDLAQKGRKVETERNDFLLNNKLIQQQKENLEARNNALQRTNDTFKSKISSLEKECRDSQRKLFDVQRDQEAGSSQLRKLEAERNELRKRVNELMECKSELKQYHSKSHDLERELNYLRTQCKKIESERNEFSTELANCLKERNRLEGRTAELEKLTRDNEKLEEKFHTLKLKIAELTSQRDDAEVQLPTLKAKVALLKKTCKEKDGTLEKMKAELREIKHSMTDSALDGVSSFPSFRAGSTDKSVRFSEATDMNNNHVTLEDSVTGKKFVALFDYDPERLSTTGHPEKELKLKKGDVITVNSDLDMNGYYIAELDGVKGLVSSLYVEEIDEYEVRRLKKQRESNSPKNSSKIPELHPSPPRALANIPGLVKRPFVALKDYNPFTSSTSTRPDLELPLTAGEVVTVVGDVDANGYYTVEKAGRLAIVPSNLVKPSSPSLTRPNKLHFTAPVHTTDQGQSTVIHAVPTGSNPFPARGVTERTVRHSSVENILNTHNTSSGNFTRGTTESKAMNISSVLPMAPRNLRVLRCVNKDALLLGWITPTIDELGRSNGQLVKGYKIFANGQPKLDVQSPYMAKALVENLDLTRPVELAIQTIADNGFCSEKSLAHFNEAVMLETASVTTEDVSHLENSNPYRTFVALFSYDPLKSSPNPNPTFELEFQEGDIIRILDTSRPDGYYTGQVNGHEGLVPSNFLEEIAVATQPQGRKRDKELNSSNASLRSTSSLSPIKAKAMVALYDYDPTTQSPNKRPDRELSLRKGQIVRVLGSMRSDGFYEADISGQRGLVPSSFLKPCKRKTTKSVQSPNGLNSLSRRVQFAHEQDSRQVTAGYV